MIDIENQQWHRNTPNGTFLISTQKALLDHSFINAALATQEMPWAKPLPADDLNLMLENSVTAAIYEVTPSIPPPATIDEPSTPREGSPTLDPEKTYRMIGMARIITDHVTFAYLTDVYIAPEFRGHGLAKWLITCVKELFGMHSALRRMMLLTSSEKLSEFYRRDLGAWVCGEKEDFIVMTGNQFQPA